MESGVENVAANSNQKLTDSELDALLEAAKAATQEHPLQIIRYEHGGARMFSAFEDDVNRNLIADFYDEASREFYFRANPATIERLVLMARDLQADVVRYKTGFDDYVRRLESQVSALREETQQLQRDLAEEKRLRAELKQIAQTGIAEVSNVGTALKDIAVHDAIEHFRARVVRAIRGEGLDRYLTNAEVFAKRIESLPLVQKEETQ